LETTKVDKTDIEQPSKVQKLLYLHSALTNEARDVMKNKNHDYSLGDDPFRNLRSSGMIGIDPKDGILVRMLDKINRLHTLISSDAAVKDESVKDTIIDIIDYSVLFYGLVIEEDKHLIHAEDIKCGTIEAKHI
jgi:hypothetical protein